MRCRTAAATIACIACIPLTVACGARPSHDAERANASPAAQEAADEEGCKDLIREELLYEDEVESVLERGACKGISADRVDELIDSVATEEEEALGDRGDDTVSLNETVTYEDDTEVSLSGFARGVSSGYAAPENTPYVKFTVKIVNGSGTTMDLNEMFVECQYGEAGQSGEEIFDEGLDGTPSTHLRPGRSISAPFACELPKSERYTQIEVTPDAESETAIFAGDVKR